MENSEHFLVETGIMQYEMIHKWQIPFIRGGRSILNYLYGKSLQLLGDYIPRLGQTPYRGLCPCIPAGGLRTSASSPQCPMQVAATDGTIYKSTLYLFIYLMAGDWPNKRLQLGTCESFFRSNGISNRIGRPIRFWIESSNRIGCIPRKP